MDRERREFRRLMATDFVMAVAGNPAAEARESMRLRLSIHKRYPLARRDILAAQARRDEAEQWIAEVRARKAAKRG